MPQLRSFSGIALAILIGWLAVAGPLVLSVELAWREGLGNQRATTLSYALDVLRRTDEMAQQMGEGLTLIQKAHLPPCSPAEIDLMRRIDISSSYIQALGRIEGNRIVCNSLGWKGTIDVGPPDLVTARGATERTNVNTPIAPHHPLLIFSMDGIAYFLDTSLAIDTPTEGSNIDMAIFVPSAAGHPMIGGHIRNLNPEWLRTIPPGASTTFVSSGYLIAIVRSATTDVAVIAAAPSSYVASSVRRFSLIFIPMGLACALLLAWATARISLLRFSLPSILRSAARRREFFVEYQPIVDLDSRCWIGAEALVRWRRNDGKVVRPDSFISIAEENGIITQITACVAERVAADIPALLRIDPQFFIAINLSGSDLRSPRTIDLFRTLLTASNVQPKNITAEATERGFVEADESRQTLNSLRELGIAVAIDDFGTGYSSLSRLENLKLDCLKIDKSFVASIGTDGATSQVVLHIIQMAHALHLRMTAEGVETDAQAEFLHSRGVHYAQGWLFGKPMRLAALCEALKARQTSTTPSCT